MNPARKGYVHLVRGALEDLTICRALSTASQAGVSIDLRDDRQSWDLQSDGAYAQRKRKRTSMAPGP